MMNLEKFLYIHMVAKQLSTLETDTLESMQMQHLVLVGNPAVCHGAMFQELSKILK
jgi:hypothetical protein